MALLNENRDREELTLSDVLENDADGESKLVKLPTFSIEPYPDSLAAYIVCEKSEKFKILHCSERMRIFVGYEPGELEDKTLEVMTGDLTDHSLLLDTYASMCDKGSASTELIVYHKHNIPIIAEVRMQLLDGVDDYFGDHVQKDIHIVFEPKTILLSTSVGKVRTLFVFLVHYIYFIFICLTNNFFLSHPNLPKSPIYTRTSQGWEIN